MHSQFTTPAMRRGDTVRETLYDKIEQHLEVRIRDVIKMEFIVVSHKIKVKKERLMEIIRLIFIKIKKQLIFKNLNI